MDRDERRADAALRRRVDALLERVQAARAEIVERGLDAVDASRDSAAGDAAASRLPVSDKPT
jgi:hypothetical protein